jgi:hypothetical protein
MPPIIVPLGDTAGFAATMTAGTWAAAGGGADAPGAVIGPIIVAWNARLGCGAGAGAIGAGVGVGVGADAAGATGFGTVAPMIIVPLKRTGAPAVAALRIGLPHPSQTVA